jgi:hypothetical protein
MLIFMNMRDISLQLTATDPTRLKIDHSPASSTNTKIEQKQAHHDKIRSTDTNIEQTQAHHDKLRPIVDL